MQFKPVLFKGQLLLPSPSSLCLPRGRPMNWRRGAEARNTTLFRKLADLEDCRLVISDKASYLGLDASFFIESETERR